MARTGRPTKYNPQLCQKLVDFFNRPATIDKIKTYQTKAGTTIEEPFQVVNILPTFERFAFENGMTVQVIYDYEKKFPEFKHSFTQAKELQKDFIIQNGFSGLANPVFGKFVAINLTDMRDQMVIGGAGLEDVLGSLSARKKAKKKAG